MSVKTALMRAFGFGGSEDDEDELSGLPSALPVYQQQTTKEPSVVGERAEAAPMPEEAGPKVPSDLPRMEFPMEVFDSLLRLFNDAQPDFIRRCVDTEAQRKYLYDNIDAGFKAALADYQAKALAHAGHHSDAALRRLQQELEQLRAQKRGVDKALEDAREEKMSAIRQKRALNESKHDLESQLAQALAEKDQYQLEIKSLMNKLKVAQVREDAGMTTTVTAGDADNGELNELRESLAKAQAALSECEQLLAEKDAQLAEKDRLLTARDELLSERNRQVVERDRLVNELREQLDAAKALLEEAKAQPTPATPKVTFTPAEKEEPMEPAMPTVAAEPEPEITPAVNEEPEQRRKRRRGRKPKNAISAIDDTLDTTEWLIATPPEGQSVKQVSTVSDAEFGYHEAPRDEHPISEAQLSLFD